MGNKEIVVITGEINQIGFEDICKICHISPDYLYELVLHDVLIPKGHDQHDWLFDARQFMRLKKAIRLQKDLEIDYAGLAVVLDLLEQIDELEQKMEIFQKHFFSLR